MTRTSEQLDALEQEAHDLGVSDGASAAGWYFDGNTTIETYRRVVAQFDEGDPELYDTFPSPLSGEWADGTLPGDVCERLGVSLDDDAADDLLRMYEDGYGVAFADTVERDARRGASASEEWTADQWEASIAGAARAMSRRFTTRTRDDDTSYVTLTEDADDWMRDVVREAHADMLPDDWRYDAIAAAVEFVADTPDYDDRSYEWADGMASPYYSDLIAWLGSNGRRMAYCDEAAEEWGAEDKTMGERIALGQVFEAMEVLGLVSRALERIAEEEYERRIGRVGAEEAS